MNIFLFSRMIKNACYHYCNVIIVQYFRSSLPRANTGIKKSPLGTFDSSGDVNTEGLACRPMHNRRECLKASIAGGKGRDFPRESVQRYSTLISFV